MMLQWHDNFATRFDGENWRDKNGNWPEARGFLRVAEIFARW